MSWKDNARFYDVGGRKLPSVTTVLQVVNKPALGPWFAKEERKHFEAAMLEVAAEHERLETRIHPTALLDEVLKAVAGHKAAEKTRDAAMEIGTQAHAMIEWLTCRMLALACGPEPVISDAAMVAVESWKDWAKSVDFQPLHVEPVVYSLADGYAGRTDVIAKVAGVVTLVDYKSGRAVWPEAHLQIIAYRHAARAIGIDTDAGLILRLPKTLTDPTFEAVMVTDSPVDDFLAALRLWQWQRRMSGQPTG